MPPLQVPSLHEAIALVGAGLGEAERESKVFHEMQLYVKEGRCVGTLAARPTPRASPRACGGARQTHRPVVEMLDELFADLQLEDLRQV